MMEVNSVTICDKVAVMNDGYIHQIEKPFNLMNKPSTLFVSTFILGNNVLDISYKDGLILSLLGNIKVSDFPEKASTKYLSISPKFISIDKSSEGRFIVISKEFLGDFYMYKVLLNDLSIRVSADIKNNLEVGDKCNLKLIKNGVFFLYPGGFKNII